MFLLNDNILRIINTIMVTAIVIPAALIAYNSFISKSHLRSVRYVMLFSFGCIALAAILSININILIFNDILPEDVFYLANIRNLVKNTGMLILTFGFLYVLERRG